MSVFPRLVAAVACAVVVTACPVVDDEASRRERPGEGEGEGEDVFGPGVAGDVCELNADCGEGLRCGCDGACACEPGERGAGQLGDACASGNDCASSVCIDGPPPSTLCTVACVDDGDCGGALPICADIAFVGRVCIREPPAP